MTFRADIVVLYIKDLTAINEGNLDFFDEDKLLINIDKVEILGIWYCPLKPGAHY